MKSHILLTVGIFCFHLLFLITTSFKCNGKCKCYGKRLDCSGAGLDKVVFNQEIFKEGTIKTIDMRRNDITSLPVYNSTFMSYAVENMNFDSNEIKGAAAGMIGRTFPMLKSLSFLHNKIKKIQKADFLFLIELEHLDLGDNEITEIAPGSFFSQDKLKNLYLEGNQLKVINPMAFQGLTNLKVLKINDNNLTFVESEWFAHFSKLEELSVQNNAVKYLRPFDMKWPRSMKKLDLSNNKLQYIPNFPPFENIMETTPSWLFDLRHNDITCDCVISDIQQYKSTELINIVCGIMIDCKLGMQNYFSNKRNTCEEADGMKHVENLQNQPTCQMPDLKLKLSRSNDQITKLECVGTSIPTPHVKIKHKDGQFTTGAGSKRNVATLYISSNNQPMSDFVCVATNSLGSVESSHWLGSRMVSINLTYDHGCKDTTQEYMESSKNNFAFAYLVFAGCMLSNLVIVISFCVKIHRY